MHVLLFFYCRPRRRSGSSIVVIDGDDLKPCLPDDYISSQHYRQHSGDSKEIDQEMLTMLSVNQDNGEYANLAEQSFQYPFPTYLFVCTNCFCLPSGPHREMAVDCPDNFIARNKTPPRYPPPHRPPQVNSLKLDWRSRKQCTSAMKKNCTNHSNTLPNKHKCMQALNLNKSNTLTCTTTKTTTFSKHSFDTQALNAQSPTQSLSSSQKSSSSSPSSTETSSPIPPPLPTSPPPSMLINQQKSFESNTASITNITNIETDTNQFTTQCVEIFNGNGNRLIVTYHSKCESPLPPPPPPPSTSSTTTTTTIKPTTQTIATTTSTNTPPTSSTKSTSTFTKIALLNDTNTLLKQQNLYNQQHQLKLDQIENYENNLATETERPQYAQQKQSTVVQLNSSQPPTQQYKTNNNTPQQQQPPTAAHIGISNNKKAYPPLNNKYSATSSNPNGSGTPPTPGEEFELMAIDGGLLQRAGSSSYSSSYEESISKSSFDSIAYCHLHNKNNNINSLNNNNININHYNNTSNSSNSSSPSKRGGGVGGGSGAGSGSGGVGGSLNSSAGSSPSGNDAPLIEGLGGAPPEYELLPLSMCKQVAASLLQPSGKHRELPVDVPDSFIEIVKTPPRYPPPPHLSSLSSQLSSNSSTSTANTTLTHINSSSASSTNTNNTTNYNNNNSHTNENSFSPMCSSVSGSYSALASISATATASGIVSLSSTCSPPSMDHQSSVTTKSTSGCHPLKQLVKQKSLLSLGSLSSSIEKLDKSTATQRQQPQPQVPSGGSGISAVDGCFVSTVGKSVKTSTKRNDEVLPPFDTHSSLSTSLSKL